MVTAKTIETIEFVRDKLLAQNCKSLNSEGACRFRGDNGTKCALGWIIPDYLYRKKLENFPTGYLLLPSEAREDCVKKAQKRISKMGIGFKLGLKLQEIHDSDKPENWEFRFSSLIESLKERIA